MEKLHSTTKDIIEENSNRAQQIEVRVWDIVVVRSAKWFWLHGEKKIQKAKVIESYSGYICSHASGFISGGGSVLVLQIWKIALKYSNKMIEYR